MMAAASEGHLPAPEPAVQPPTTASASATFVLGRQYSDADDATTASLLHPRLVTAVSSAHSLIHSSAVVHAIQRAQLPLAHYILYLATLAHIYSSLESALTHATADSPDGAAAAVTFPRQLFRSAAIKQDLRFFVGCDAAAVRWLAAAETSATRAWCERMHSLARDSELSHLLVAHAYVRFLGDLSGGQLLRGRVAKMYLLPANADGDGFLGANFYEFRDVQDTKEFKEMFRMTLNRVGDEVGEQKAQTICDEAVRSFGMNREVLEQLANVAAGMGALPTAPLAAAGVPDHIKSVGLPPALAAQAAAAPMPHIVAPATDEPRKKGHRRTLSGKLVPDFVDAATLTQSLIALGFAAVGFAVGRAMPR